jgi:fimbrial chaperone protein
MIPRETLVRAIVFFVIGSATVYLLALMPLNALASNFSITPTSLELSGSAKSGVFSVVNGGDEKLNCQIDLKEWSQDAEGKDVYTEAKDMVFFPKIMTVEAKSQRAIRIGIKGPLSIQEKTYRLFVEEIPSQKKRTGEQEAAKITAGLSIAFRYATPIFVKPARVLESMATEKTEMAKGVVKTLVKNTGNVHVKLLSVTFRGTSPEGKELFSREVAGWYILRGVSRSYEVTVPQEICGDLALVEVTAKSENAAINGKVNVQKEMCAP